MAQSEAASNASDQMLTLRPGDMVRVDIWREEELSGEFRVDEMGVVTLPLLGEKKVNGVPVRELRDTLIAEYRVELVNPSITVTPLRQVHVLGYVNQPGIYTIDPTTSLAGAVALAGGASRATARSSRMASPPRPRSPRSMSAQATRYSSTAAAGSSVTRIS